MPLSPVNAEKKYWAFISYSSKDKKWGQWLHKRLENYPIPKEFQGTEIFDGAVLGKNLRPIFRDRDELAGSAELGPAILKALEHSRYLIVLCSRNSARSQWVNKEIEDFKKLGGEKHILALILDGEPNATSIPDVSDTDECFPPALRYPLEPLAGDLRKDGDGKERGFLKVLAGIAQLDFDALYRRHERTQRKKRLLSSLASLAIISILVALTTFAWTQRNDAARQRDVVREQLSLSLYRSALENHLKRPQHETRLKLLKCLTIEPDFTAAADQLTHISAHSPATLATISWQHDWIGDPSSLQRFAPSNSFPELIEGEEEGTIVSANTSIIRTYKGVIISLREIHMGQRDWPILPQNDLIEHLPLLGEFGTDNIFKGIPAVSPDKNHLAIVGCGSVADGQPDNQSNLLTLRVFKLPELTFQYGITIPNSTNSSGREIDPISLAWRSDSQEIAVSFRDPSINAVRIDIYSLPEFNLMASDYFREAHMPCQYYQNAPIAVLRNSLVKLLPYKFYPLAPQLSLSQPALQSLAPDALTLRYIEEEDIINKHSFVLSLQSDIEEECAISHDLRYEARLSENGEIELTDNLSAGPPRRFQHPVIFESASSAIPVGLSWSSSDDYLIVCERIVTGGNSRITVYEPRTFLTAYQNIELPGLFVANAPDEILLTSSGLALPRSVNFSLQHLSALSSLHDTLSPWRLDRNGTLDFQQNRSALEPAEFQEALNQLQAIWGDVIPFMKNSSP